MEFAATATPYYQQRETCLDSLCLDTASVTAEGPLARLSRRISSWLWMDLILRF